MTKLLNATSIGEISVVRKLIIEGYDVNEFSTSGNCPLLEAASHNNTQIVELLLEHGADPQVVDRKGQSPLDWAQKNKNTKMEDMINDKLNEKNRFNVN